MFPIILDDDVTEAEAMAELTRNAPRHEVAGGLIVPVAAQANGSTQ